MGNPEIYNEQIADRSLAGNFTGDYPAWFRFEESFPHSAVRQWYRQNKHFSLCLSIVYIAAAHLGRRLMVGRQKFELRRLLLAWNVLMASFSFFLALRVVTFFVERVTQLSFYGVICDSSQQYAVNVIVWLDIFVLTKATEFIDTLFVILRKQDLTFLHWYHHSTVVIVCWYALGASRGPPNCLLYALMNSTNHAFIYSYLALKVLRFKPPHFISIVLTTMQIAEMFIGLAANMAAGYFMFLRHDRPCDDDPQQIFVASSVYLSYFFLFCHFFYKAYIGRNNNNTRQYQSQHGAVTKNLPKKRLD